MWSISKCGEGIFILLEHEDSKLSNQHRKYIFLFLGFVLFQIITTFFIYPISIRYLIDYITEFGRISYMLEWGSLFIFVIVYVMFYATFIFYYRNCIRGKAKFSRDIIVFIKSNFKTFLLSKLFIVFTIDIISNYVKCYFRINSVIIGHIFPDFVVYLILVVIGDCIFIQLSILNLGSKRYDINKIKNVFKEFILKPEFIKIIVVLMIIKIPYFVHRGYIMDLSDEVEFGESILGMLNTMWNIFYSLFDSSSDYIHNILQIIVLAISHMYILIEAAKIEPVVEDEN